MAFSVVGPAGQWRPPLQVPPGRRLTLMRLGVSQGELGPGNYSRSDWEAWFSRSGTTPAECYVVDCATDERPVTVGFHDVAAAGGETGLEVTVDLLVKVTDAARLGTLLPSGSGTIDRDVVATAIELWSRSHLVAMVARHSAAALSSELACAQLQKALMPAAGASGLGVVVRSIDAVDPAAQDGLRVRRLAKEFKRPRWERLLARLRRPRNREISTESGSEAVWIVLLLLAFFAFAAWALAR